MFGYIFKTPELKKRLLVTLGLLALYRLGIFISIPGTDQTALSGWVREMKGGFFSIFSLGIMPFLSASLLFQISSFLIPHLRKLSEGGKDQRLRMAQYTYLGTALICIFQSLGLSRWIQSQISPLGFPLVANPGLGFQLATVITLTVGTFLLLFLARLINKYGIGNGVSLILLTGIVGKIPPLIVVTARKIPLSSYTINDLNPFPYLFIAGAIFLSIAFVVMIWLSHQRVPVQHKDQTIYLPFHIGQTGLAIPIVLASSFLSLPATLIGFFGGGHLLFGTLLSLFSPASLFYNLLYALLIIFFAYLYTAITTNTDDIAKTMERYDLSIPDCPSGESTANYLDRVLDRTVLVWALFIVGIALLPRLLSLWRNFPFYFGGTSLIIVVAVILDTFSHLKESVSGLKEVFWHTDTTKIRITKILLEFAGIKTFVYGETYGKILGLNWGPLAEKKILVSEEDYPKACECLTNSLPVTY